MTYRIVVVAGENEVLRTSVGQLDDTIEIKHFDSANEALWEVRSDPPEVIVADVDLPEMTGLEMAEILPNFDVPTKIVLCSRTQNPQAKKEANTFGVSRFLQGSFSKDELQSAISDAIQEYHAMAATTESVPEPEPEPEPTPQPVSERRSRSVERTPPPPPPPPPPSSSSRSRLSERASRASTTSSPPRGTSLSARAAELRASEKSAQEEGEGETHHIRRRSGTLVLTAANLNLIRSIMSQLSQELGPQCILLTDRAGMVLVEVGTTDKLPVMILLPLLSTSFATSGEVSRQLGEEDATTLYIHEGLNYDLYCFDIMQSYLLVLVFNKKVASSKIGAVWVNTKRAIRELHDALAS